MRKLGYFVEVLAYGLFVGVLVAAFFQCQEAKAGTFFRYRQHGTQSFTDDERRIPKAAEGVERFMPRELHRTVVERVTPDYRQQPVGTVVVAPVGQVLRGTPEEPSYYIQLPHYPTCHHDYATEIRNPLEQPWHTCDPE